MRLGDRLALTQVVDGYGAKDLALDMKALLKTPSHTSANRLDAGAGEPPRASIASIAPHERSPRAESPMRWTAETVDLVRYERS